MLRSKKQTQPRAANRFAAIANRSAPEGSIGEQAFWLFTPQKCVLSATSEFIIFSNAPFGRLSGACQQKVTV
jgi:hypothetical protein